MRFVKESRIQATPSDVFAFHERPGTLERLTPPWEPVVVVRGDGSLRPGNQVILRMRLGPFSLKWVAIHEVYDPPHLFADRQESGPFASWYHEHQFCDDGQGGTQMRDEVEFRLPGGRIGQFLGGGFVLRKLKRVFDYRHEMTRECLETGRPSSEHSQ